MTHFNFKKYDFVEKHFLIIMVLFVFKKDLKCEEGMPWMHRRLPFPRLNSHDSGKYLSMLKASLFAKRAKYSSARNVNSNPNLILRDHYIQQENVVAARSTRVMAPNAESISVEPKQSEFARDLFATTQATLLRNYQAEVMRQADIITKQRKAISKMRAKSMDIQSLLKQQHHRLDDLGKERKDLKVRLVLFC